MYARLDEHVIPKTPVVPAATVGGHAEEPIVAEKPAVTEGLAPVVAPGPNVFEQKAGDNVVLSASSVAPENPPPKPAVSEAAVSDAYVPGVAPPLPLEPDDLITSDEELPATPEVVIAEETSSVVVEESSSEVHSSSAPASVEVESEHSEVQSESEVFTHTH